MTPPKWPVIGIGASAESLDSLIAFVAAPADAAAVDSSRADSSRLADPPRSNAAAYVVVARGLASEATDALVDDLRRAASAPVTGVEEVAILEPGHIYVASADRWPLVEEGRLQFASSPAQRRDAIDHGPIDQFLESLASEYGESAIAVILAGAGDDGAVGVRAIRDLGGVALAQHPDTASSPEMPASAVASGLIDAVLPPDALASRVREYVDLLGDDGFGAASRSPLRDSFARGRGRPASQAAATRRLPRTPRPPSRREPQLLRDPEAWLALRERVLEPLLRGRSATVPFRAWVACSSSGDDAYSLAMFLAQTACDLDIAPEVRILASVVDAEELALARRGAFSTPAIDELPVGLHRYFALKDNAYRLIESVRNTIVFAQHSLFLDVPFSRLDLIVCRDVVSTFDQPARAHLFEVFHRALNPGGMLFLGARETIAAPGSRRRYEAVDRRHRIFRARGEEEGLGRAPVLIGTEASIAPSEAPSGTAASKTSRPAGWPRSSSARLLRRSLLDHFAPAAVLTDENLSVLYIHGDVGDFLSPPDGERSAELLDLLAPSLVASVRSAARRALDEELPALEVAEPDGRDECVLITAVPIEGPGRRRLLSVTFTRRAPIIAGGVSERAEPELQSAFIDAEGSPDRSRWRSALDAWSTAAAHNRRLLSVIDRQQVSHEDLAASQEELRTMFEEIEHANARLLVVNAEMEAQLFQLKALSDDVVHLLEGTELAAVFLDAEGRVRRFTPAAREFFRLLPTDVGRPLSDFAREFEDQTLDADIARALASSLSAEGVARWKKDRWFLRRVIPYWTARGDVDGVALTFTDISTRHRAEETLRRSNAELEERVRQRTAVAVLQQDIAVIANSSAPMERAFASTLERLCRDEPWMGGHVFVVREGTAEDSVWYEDARNGRRLESVLGGISFAAGEGLVGQVAEDGEPRFAGELDSDERFSPERRSTAGVRSVAVFPILAGERVVGAFEFFSRRTDPPSADLFEVMRNVGTQLGRVIEREEARERLFELAVEEQRSLGEELHDTLSQQVHGLAMLAQSMVKNLSAAGVDESHLHALVDGLVETHKQIRVLSNGLVPVRVEGGGLSGALEEMARGWQQMHGADCVFEHVGDNDLEDDRVATALYRIAREAARNAVLHGEALRVVIRLTERDEGLTLEVRDDGRGMTTVPENGPGMGLQIMRHRAEQVGGTLEIESSPGQGTVVRCRIVATRGVGGEAD